MGQRPIKLTSANSATPAVPDPKTRAAPESLPPVGGGDMAKTWRVEGKGERQSWEVAPSKKTLAGAGRSRISSDLNSSSCTSIYASLDR